MSGGPEIEQAISKFVSHVIFIVIALFGLFILIVWGLLLLSYVGITPWPVKPDLATLLVAFALSLSVLLALLWVSASLHIVNLDNGVKKTIGRLLIFGVLSSVVTAIGSALTK